MENISIDSMGSRQSLDAYVAKTAELVEQNGKLPTYGELRMAMGGVGSQSTLRDAINTFKAKLEVTEKKKADFQDAPEDFTKALVGDFQQMLGSIWRKASELADAKLEAARKAIDAERMEWEQERKQLEELSDQLESDLVKAQEDAKAKAGQIEALDDKLMELTDQITDLKVELGQERTKADERGLRVATLEGQLTEKGKELETVRTAQAATTEKLHQAQSERDVLKAKLDAAEVTLKKEQGEHATEIKKREDQASELERKLDTKDKEVKQALTAQVRAEAEAANLAEQLLKVTAGEKPASTKTRAKKGE